MPILFLVLPALLLAGAVSAQSAGRSSPADSRSNVPPVEYRSAFEGYRLFADEKLLDWRKSNDEVGAAGGHAGHPPGHSPGRQASKPQPRQLERSRAPAEISRDAPHHGGHK